MSCEHLDFNDEGVCSCGMDVTSQEYINSLPEVPETNLGDLMGIIRLAQDTATLYHERCNTLQWVGAQIIRPPSEVVWSSLLEESFFAAKSFGYRGDYQRWSEICKEYAEK